MLGSSISPTKSVPLLAGDLRPAEFLAGYLQGSQKDHSRTAILGKQMRFHQNRLLPGQELPIRQEVSLGPSGC